MAPFGGGMGSSGRTCGTLAGALAVIGYTLGKIEANGRDHKLMWKLSYKLVTGFDEICKPYGGANCRDIAQVNWKNHVAVMNFYKNPKSSRQNCVQVIRETSNLLYDLITEHFPEEE